ISFKILPTTLSAITSVRIDLEVADVSAAFNNDFSSITLSTGDLIAGNTAWTTIELPISSFPIQTAWTDLAIESVPFANALTIYGVRFVLNGSTGCSINVDDLRFVAATPNALDPYFYTKQFDLGSKANKDYRRITLDMDRSANTNVRVDAYKDFGGFSTPRFFGQTVRNEIIAADINNQASLSRLDSISYAVLESTIVNPFQYDVEHLASDGQDVYAGDANNFRIFKKSLTNLRGPITASFGELGSGATNYAGPHQIALDDKRVYHCDWANHKVMVLNKKDLSYVTSFGSLGTGNTSFHIPTGITVDVPNVFIGDDGNQRIVKYGKGDSSFSYITQVQLDMNTAGELTLANNENFLFDAYNKIADGTIDFTDVILEKRSKSDLSIVSRVTIRPLNSVAISSYGVYGDIAILGPYIYISFTDDRNENGSYYIQKRLISDFSLVSELKTVKRHFGIAGDGLAYKPRFKSEDVLPGIDSQYIQFKFSVSGLDPDFRLYNMTFVPALRGITE
ncbi:6-bladed beta-propeller, partial [Candidatus Parcubacteria bacterium]|nr:6-bladed beta-propeller [Candidatus Parcubacteria bacterium]